MATPTCAATWEGGRCDRDAKHRPPPGRYEALDGKLCPSHYQQARRGGPFAALRGSHGRIDDENVGVPETVRVPARHHEAAEAEAKLTGVDRAEVYRRAIAAYFDER
jgi:hypothetical protein